MSLYPDDVLNLMAGGDPTPMTDEQKIITKYLLGPGVFSQYFQWSDDGETINLIAPASFDPLSPSNAFKPDIAFVTPGSTDNGSGGWTGSYDITFNDTGIYEVEVDYTIDANDVFVGSPPEIARAAADVYLDVSTSTMTELFMHKNSLVWWNYNQANTNQFRANGKIRAVYAPSVGGKVSMLLQGTSPAYAADTSMRAIMKVTPVAGTWRALG